MTNRIKSSFIFFINHFNLGFKYALYFMVVAALMGFIYGAFGGIWIAPAWVAVSYVGIFVLINFAFAFLLGMLNLIPAIFGRSSKRLTRYFSFSLAFLVVFFAYFAILKFSGFKPF